MVFIALVLGFLAAVAIATSDVLQRAANRDESSDLEFSPRLIGKLIRKPIWLAGIAAMTLSVALQAVGLGIGTLASVEPLLVLELPLSLVGAAIWLGGALGRREWLAVAGMSAGTIGLIGFLGPRGGDGGAISWWVWPLAIGATAGVSAAVFGLGHRATDPGRRAMLLGISAGTADGLAAALIKGMTVRFSDGGIVAALTAWQLYAAVGAGVTAFWLRQNAVNAGRLVAAQPGMTLCDPYVSIIWGALVFGESFRGGLWIALAALAGVTMSVSAVVLAGASAVQGEQAAEERSRPGDPYAEAGGRGAPASPG